MRDQPHVPLWTRILLLATLNVAILGIVFAVFLRLQLRPEFESFLMAESRERIASITRLVAAELQNTDGWDGVMARYSKEYGITMLLYRNTGEQLAGSRTPLPPEVDVRMPRGGPQPPSRGGSPPPREGERRGPPPWDGDRRGPPPPRDGPPARPRPEQPPPPDGRSRPGPPQPDIGSPFLAVTKSDPHYWVGVRMPIIDRPDHEGLRSVLMFVSPNFFTNRFFFDIRPWLGVAAGVIFISALCWLPLVRNLTHSIADMMRATARIAEGRFDVSLKAQRRDELGRLVASINRMAGRLQTLTEGRKRFLGAVAHELRSPIARMQLATEILQRNTAPSAQKYIDDLRDDIAMMSRLTDELLQVARAEAMPERVKLQPTNVAEAVRTAVRRESLDEMDIRIDVDPTMHAQADPEHLMRSLGNILRNAARYAGNKGPIHVSARRENDRITIIVADSGPGVPEDALEKIFTPFYRLDDSRDRESGGTGLGLAIVRSCIEACGGAVDCRNRQPSGLEVRISLPAS